MKISEELASFLQKKIAEKNWTRRKVMEKAKELGKKVGLTSVWAVLRGKSVSPRTLSAVTKALGVSNDEIKKFTGEEPKEETKKEELEMSFEAVEKRLKAANNNLREAKYQLDAASGEVQKMSQALASKLGKLYELKRGIQFLPFNKNTD